MTVLALRDGNAPLRRRCAAESWVMPTEALGSAKEAHRQWPEGRSEQGASKAKDGPSHGGALPRETLQLRNRDGRAPLFRVATHLFRFMWQKCVGLARQPFSNFAGTFSFAG
jgi:hypothetical protein